MQENLSEQFPKFKIPSKITSFIQTIKNSSVKEKIIYSLVVFFILLFLIAIPLTVFVAKNNQKPQIITDVEYVPNEIIVKYSDNINPEQFLNEKLKSLGVISQEKVFDDGSGSLKNYYLLRLKKGSDTEKITETISKYNGIQSAELNGIMKAFASPNDPMFSNQWAFNKIDAQNAWEIDKGSNITVAVIDTGIDLTHPDLQSQIVGGYNFVSSSSSADDDYFHGSHVAGIIGASTNNSVGVAGVNWNIRLMPIKVLSASGSGPTDAVARGIKYAADNGAKVINMSLGGLSGVDSGDGCDSLTQDAVNYAVSKGVVVIAAAGNDNKSIDSTYQCQNKQTGQSYPCKYSPATCNNVISVGATGPSDEKSSYSNYGSTVDISAPGGNGTTGNSGSTILSTVPNSQTNAMSGKNIPTGYYSLQGTSMAAPFVAGVAALLLSANSGLSPDQVRSCLIDNADQVSSSSVIGPRLNAFKTLNACSGLTPISPVPTATPAVQPSVSAVPTQSQIPSEYPFILTTSYLDINGNNSYDTNIDELLPGVKYTLTQANGSYSKTLYSDSVGKALFSKINTGNYTLKASYENYESSEEITNIKETDAINYIVGFPAERRVSPVISPSPTPTVSPISGGGSSSTPTPIPTIYQTANCVFDPSTCKSGTGALQQCILKCTP